MLIGIDREFHPNEEEKGVVSTRVFPSVVVNLSLVLLSLVVCAGPANADYQLTIGSTPDSSATASGVIGVGPPPATVPVDQGETGSDAAAALAAAINKAGGTATVSKNVLTVKSPPGKKPAIIEPLGLFDKFEPSVIKTPTPAPGKISTSFNTPNPSETFGSTGSLSVSFALAGSFDIVGTTTFSSTDTFASATTSLYDDLISQSSSLPSGYSFELDPGNVISLDTPDMGGIAVSLGVTTTSGILPADAISSFDFSPSAVPEPTSCVLLGLGLLGSIGLRRRSRMFRGNTASTAGRNASN